MQLPHSFLWRHRTGRSQPMLAGSFCLQRNLLRSGKRSPADAENALGKAAEQSGYDHQKKIDVRSYFIR